MRAMWENNRMGTCGGRHLGLNYGSDRPKGIVGGARGSVATTWGAKGWFTKRRYFVIGLDDILLCLHFLQVQLYKNIKSCHPLFSRFINFLFWRALRPVEEEIQELG